MQPDELPEFEVTIRPAGDVVVLQLHGDLCMRTAPEVAERLTQVAAGHPSEVVFDLRDVEFMDSNGVRLLIETDERAKREGFDFAISLNGDQPSRVLELVGMIDWPRRVPAQDLPVA